jgi:hypothetical protein
MRTLPRVLRPGGGIAITTYERKPWTIFYAKYLLRPLTKRMDKQKLLAGIESDACSLSLNESVLSIAHSSDVFLCLPIPVANYVHENALTPQQRYDWAILDTFDMLSPQYDQPRTRLEIE